jgi:Asp-tRNA(Asn)/Glu-tRNA(Gln) amidotransferase A subunit family amidase
MGETIQAELTALSASELARLIAVRELSATEAVKAHIKRIEELDGRVNAVVVPMFEEALAEAAKADGMSAQGRPLHGVPVTVKECFHVKGTASTIGLESRRDHRADQDAELVARLKAAGAIVVGKTNVPQLLIYVEADNPLYGRTNNPWNLARSPGGSSGGEGAALAAGYGALGLGTDVGGSVRIPAHFCGLQSLKPTPGKLSLRGTEDEALLSHVAIPDAAGPLARSVADLRLAMAALGSPVNETSVKGLRIGFYVDDGYFPASAAIKRAVQQAARGLETAGCSVKEFSPPDILEVLQLFYGLFTVDGGDRFKAMLKGSTYDERIKDLITLASVPNPLRPIVSALYGLRGQRRVAQVVGWAGTRSKADAASLVARRDAYRQRFLAALGDIDALICPPCSVPAVTHGATKELGSASASYTLLYNLLGWPAGVVAATRVKVGEETGRPASKDLVEETARKVDQGSVGLPVGVQVASKPGREDLVLAVMGALESHFRQSGDYPLTPVTPSAAG